MKRSVLLLTLVLVFTMLFAGCESSTVQQPYNLSENPILEEPKTLEGDQFTILQELANDFLKKEALTAITPAEVYQKVVIEEDLNYLVVDVRSSADFAAGHIEGAVNIPYIQTANQRLLENLPKDKKIIVVCYSGHTAGQTVALWNILGFDAVPMQNGMGGWKEGAGTVLPKSSYDFPVVTDIPEAANYPLPNFVSEKVVDVSALALSRSQSYLGSGKAAVVNAPTLNEIVKNNDSSYFLVDIRQAADYEKGHIQGAINIPIQNIAELDSLKKLPSNSKLVVIGYTGTEASQIVRLLNQLGYDSYALLHGMRVWTSSEEINGIAPVSTEVIGNLPLDKLNYNVEGGGGGTASCG